ncbi:hypothetical protein PWT90_05604 [Aphanocladium album]|nr:hypothetical protein PWT90_05604 [Aphanocladium album]
MSFVEDLKERRPLSKEEILHTLRGVQESEHLFHLRMYNADGKWLFQPPYNHNPIDFDSLASLRLEDADDTCNRTAGVYILRDAFDPDMPNRFTHPAVAQVLISRVFLHIYDRWFRPYRSEIDRHQFLTKTIVPPPMSLPPQTCSLAMVDWVRRLHANFCARVEYTKSLYKSEEEEQSGQQFYFMQPVFSAVAVALRTRQFTLEHEDVATLRVVVISTGREENLSAPVRLDSIPESEVLDVVHDPDDHIVAVETTLNAAITFLLALEKRETEAFGLIPDPVETTRFATLPPHRIVWTAASHGWDSDVMGPLNGPSSSWVDTGKYPAWTGLGADSRKQFPNIIKYHQRAAESYVQR